MPIRTATPADAAAIARVHVDAWRTTYRGLVPEAYLDALSYDEREAMWRRNLSNSEWKSFLYVAEAPNDAVVGFACGGPERTGNYEYTGELYAVYVLEDFQRRGLGRALASASAATLKQRGLATMMLWVLADNQPARRFYEALGGVRAGEQQTAIGGASLAEIAYGWSDVEGLIHGQPVS